MDQSQRKIKEPDSIKKLICVLYKKEIKFYIKNIYITCFIINVIYIIICNIYIINVIYIIYHHKCYISVSIPYIMCDIIYIVSIKI